MHGAKMHTKFWWGRERDYFDDLKVNGIIMVATWTLD